MKHEENGTSQRSSSSALVLREEGHRRTQQGAKSTREGMAAGGRRLVYVHRLCDIAGAADVGKRCKSPSQKTGTEGEANVVGARGAHRGNPDAAVDSVDGRKELAGLDVVGEQAVHAPARARGGDQHGMGVGEARESTRKRHPPLPPQAAVRPAL